MNYESNFGVIFDKEMKSSAANSRERCSVDFHESLYQSELYGLLAGVVSLLHIIEHHSIVIPGERNSTSTVTTNHSLRRCIFISNSKSPSPSRCGYRTAIGLQISNTGPKSRNY
jgi:hypothetical protein